MEARVRLCVGAGEGKGGGKGGRLGGREMRVGGDLVGRDHERPGAVRIDAVSGHMRPEFISGQRGEGPRQFSGLAAFKMRFPP